MRGGKLFDGESQNVLQEHIAISTQAKKSLTAKFTRKIREGRKDAAVLGFLCDLCGSS
jgi:hypothetical protein